MFASGLPLPRSLELLYEQLENRELADASRAMAIQIASGHYLSAAMKRYSWIFSPLQMRLVQVGEKTGGLAQIFNRLSTYEEAQVALKLKIRSALTMPFIVSIACILLVIFIPPFLFEGLFRLLQDSKVALPLPTKILIGFSNALRSWWFYALGVGFLGLLAWLGLQYQKKRDWQVRVMESALEIPVLGRVLRLIAVNRFARAWETMVAVGMPSLVSLELSAKASGNPVLEDRMGQVLALIKDGTPLNQALNAADFFPSSFIQGVEVGEESGKLTDMLKSLAGLYDVELESSFDMLAHAVEPFVLVIVGSIVGFTVVSTMLPMLKVIETL